LCERLRADTEASRILLLDGIVDPRNFGALLRTAEAAGIKQVIIPKDRSVDVTPAAAAASAGAVHHLEVYKVTNLRRALQSLKEMGYWVVGLEASAKQTIYQAEYPDRLVIVLGGEASGVRPINQRECDYLVSIPMVGKVSSLNVGVAGGVFLFELLRRSRAAQGALNLQQASL
jgi:23S rRNA (guanosine2251-2'-O)-methyltransferase